MAFDIDACIPSGSMVGEFLSASVGGPFLFFMLEDLGVPGGGGESAIGFWAGIVCESGRSSGGVLAVNLNLDICSCSCFLLLDAIHDCLAVGIGSRKVWPQSGALHLAAR